MISDPQDPQIQRVWLEVLSRRLSSNSLPQPLRDQFLLALLNSPNWARFDSLSFTNLHALQTVLEAIRSSVEGGEILVLNFVFQNLMPREGSAQSAKEQPHGVQKKETFGSQKVAMTRLHCSCWETRATRTITGFRRIWRK